MIIMKRLFSNSTKIGRWEHRIPESTKDLKAIWANADHCGEIICQDPLLIKDIIRKQHLIKEYTTEKHDEQYISMMLTNELPDFEKMDEITK